MSIDFEKVTINAIKVIDSIRSKNSNLKNIDGNSVKPIESRVHAMYRAIGIPAYITDPKENNFNNGNIFEENEEATQLVKERRREDDKFFLPISASETKTLLDTTPDKIINSIDDSIKGRRGSLFPIIVDGNINIFPQDRRVAGAFYKTNTEDGIMVGDVQYRRPLIEMIVLMRLKEDGLVNSVAEQLLQDEGVFADLKADKFFSSNGKITGENILSVDTLGSLLLAIFNREGVRKILDATVKDLGRIRAEVRDNPKKVSGGDAQASQYQGTSGTDGKGTFEQINKTRNDLVARNNAKIKLLEFDDTFGGQSTKNNKDYMLSSLIIDAMLVESTTIDDQIAEEENKKKKLKQAQRNHSKNIDLLLGKFSGVSGIDILIIIAGLFAISKDDLLGLLDNDSLSRLLAIKSNTEVNSKNVKKDLNSKLGVSITETPTAALQSLEKKVKQLFAKFEKEIKILDMVKKNNIGE